MSRCSFCDKAKEMDMLLSAKNNKVLIEIIQEVIEEAWNEKWLRETDKKFKFILAWDSTFHLPFSMQEHVVTKLCNLLSDGGVLIYTFGDANGEHNHEWHGDIFYYSSIGINENLRVLAANGITCKHMELDQWPQNHVYMIGIKL